MGKASEEGQGPSGAVDPMMMMMMMMMCYIRGPGQLSRYSDSLQAGRSGDRIPVGGEIFRTCPDLSWCPPSLLNDGYRGFPGGKAAGACR